MIKFRSKTNLEWNLIIIIINFCIFFLNCTWSLRYRFKLLKSFAFKIFFFIVYFCILVFFTCILMIIRIASEFYLNYPDGNKSQNILVYLDINNNIMLPCKNDIMLPLEHGLYLFSITTILCVLHFSL